MSEKELGPRVQLRLDERTIARLEALAATNFPMPSGRGNVTALIRSMINQAYLLPDRFGFEPPRTDPPAAHE